MFSLLLVNFSAVNAKNDPASSLPQPIATHLSGDAEFEVEIVPPAKLMAGTTLDNSLLVPAGFSLGEKQFEGTEVSARMNTVAQVTPAYPPAFLACGDQDPFLSQAQELIVALAKNGVESSAYLPESKEESLGHEFQIQLDTAAGKEAMRRVTQFLADHAKVS